MRDPSALVSWGRVPVDGGASQGLRIGASTQAPLQDTNDRPSWGIAYLIIPADDATVTSALEYGNTTRSQARLSVGGVGREGGGRSSTATRRGRRRVSQWGGGEGRGKCWQRSPNRSVRRSACKPLPPLPSPRQFVASGTLPSADNPNFPATLLPQGPPLPATGPQASGRGGPLTPAAAASSTLPSPSPSQVGIDRGGDDMNGSPFTLASADYNLCWAACNKTAGCDAWAYAVPGCDSYPQVRLSQQQQQQQ